MDNQSSTSNFWGQTAQNLTEEERHAQTLERIRIISAELLKLAQESQQHVCDIKDQNEYDNQQLIDERNLITQELAEEREKNKELSLKIAVLEKKLANLQRSWNHIYEQVLSTDADMDEISGKPRKFLKLKE